MAVLGLMNLYGHVIWSGFRVQYGLTDALMENYLLEHTFRWAFNPHYSYPLGSPPYFYPLQGQFWRSENLLGAAPLYWLLRTAFTWNMAMQLWCMACSLGNFAAMTWALQRLGVRPVLAWVGGYLYAFGLTTAARLFHPEFLPRAFMVLSFYWVLRFFEAPSPRRLVAAAGFWYWQLLASLYLGYFMLLALVPMGLVLVAGRVGRMRAYLVQQWKSTGVALLGV
ncbi:MAG TPA: hypothetical protein VGO93_06225, partial [Candidatus Xenobia bacterium]